MTEEHYAPGDSGDQKEFSTVRKGYDPAEVEQCLAEYDDALRDLEEYAARLKRELHEARLEISRLEAAEQQSIDSAMRAVFDAKDRILSEATQRARQIEEQARRAAGSPLDQVHEATTDAAPEEPQAVVAADGDATDAPQAVLDQMLEEAEVIRNRLDSGLAAAFDQMEQMQRDAEVRAEELLVSARREAERLRTPDNGDEPSIAVTLTEGNGERPSRYSRNSAGLPRIGTDNGDSVLAEMKGLRERLRDGEDSDREPAPTQDAAG